MQRTTITTPATFPLTPGEILRVRNAGGKRGLWRTYTVGAAKYARPKGTQLYDATVDLAPINPYPGGNWDQGKYYEQTELQQPAA